MEMIFIMVMVVLCGSLTVLQYRWTGELAEAEMARMTSSLADQLKRAAKEFDAELTRSCAALMPTAAELDQATRESVHLRKLRRWKGGNPQPIFKHVAVAVPSGGKLELFEIDIASERFEPMEWPANWDVLRSDITHRISRGGGPPPTMNSSGTLWEFPVMGGRPPNSGGWPRGPGFAEREWMIFELDTVYLRERWLPDLIASLVNLDGQPLYDVAVRAKATDEIIFSTVPGGISSRGKTAVAEFHLRGELTRGFRGAPRSEPVWIMEAARRGGTLEAAVAGSRNRNLAVAVLLNGLMLAAGLMLLRATRNSRRLADEQMRFVANVTHELRTPLTVIRGAAHNLQRGIVKDQEGIGKYSGLIIEHAEALNAMVDQVLDFSAGRQARESAQRGPVDLGVVLRAASKAVESDPKFSGCRFDLQLPDVLPTVTSDPAALRRAFQNLIENAAKHGGTGGWVGISAEAADRSIIVRVRDNGPGIPADEIDEIFTPFFRGGKARADETRGSGLGLSLVREVASAHRGEVSVTSEPGRGSTFTLTLPTS
jgi:signal transduction histidine kinase